MKTKVIVVPSVCSIDFEMLKGEGVECVLFDIEGTIAQWGDDTVSEEIKKCINDSGITKRGLVTNLNKKHSKRADKIAKEIGAESCQYPRASKHRKPRATMLELAIHELETTEENTVMIGDKLLDVLAAKNANVRYVFWVDKYGQTDQWFDRYIYRVIEPLLKKVFA